MSFVYFVASKLDLLLKNLTQTFAITFIFYILFISSIIFVLQFYSKNWEKMTWTTKRKEEFSNR